MSKDNGSGLGAREPIIFETIVQEERPLECCKCGNRITGSFLALGDGGCYCRDCYMKAREREVRRRRREYLSLIKPLNGVPMYKRISIGLFLLFLFLCLSARVHATCGGGFLNPITDINWECIFPFKIGGVKIMSGEYDFPDAAQSPVCYCPAPPPVFMRIGIPVSFWEPARLVETVKDPWCFPSLGMQLTSLDMGTLGGSNGGVSAATRSANSFAQAHYWLFPVWSVMELLTDISCLEHSGFDVGYLTEIDPLWNDDSMAAIINPEAAVFGNMIVQLSCMADAAGTVARWPLSPLFWCMGSWGSAYPMTGRVNNAEYVEANAGIAAKLIYKLCRQFMICDTGVYYCACVPTPIWVKHNYVLQAAKPVRSAGCACIGRTSMLWGSGVNKPVGGDNFVWTVFRKRACCVF